MSNAVLGGSLETFSQACVSSRPVGPSQGMLTVPCWVPRGPSAGAQGSLPVLSLLLSDTRPVSFPCLGLPDSQLSALPHSLRGPVGLPLNSSFLHGGLQTVKETGWAVVGLTLTLSHLPGTLVSTAGWPPP